ncbi:protein of unknown function [Kyrpidia spormannii]|uniref:Uncharacterized protein n=2 Tax=Kyrpidia spormannii TaxID=2055160 RepID=A0ACA8Z5R2_9BACL|nr:protein of unknown function [Kyrpidia spormannii]CAB3390994.1 protein of unknown function [Kyrpidia spormannii]
MGIGPADRGFIHDGGLRLSDERAGVRVLRALAIFCLLPGGDQPAIPGALSPRPRISRAYSLMHNSCSNA